VNGYLCRARDPQDLAEKMIAIAGLAEDVRTRMGAASRRIAEDRFDERIVITKYLQAIGQLTNRTH
jgi:glycosyltransferase involved in cell wall biosynthesis